MSSSDATTEIQPGGRKTPENNVDSHQVDASNLCRLRRFLCYGSEGPTYSTREPPLTIDSALTLLQLLESGKGCEVVEEIRKCVQHGRAVRANPALFALAACSQHSDIKAKQAAFRAVKELCSVPGHLFSYVQFMKELRDGMKGGMWGRGLRKAVAEWYNSQNSLVLAQAVTKCKHRVGWSHQDLFRLSHMKPANPAISLINKYIMKGWQEVHLAYADQDNSEEVVRVLTYLEAVEKAKQQSTDELELVHLIEQHHLEREQILTNHLKSKEVWRALLKVMPLHALFRLLGKMTADKVLAPGSADLAAVCERIQDEVALKKSKLHPFSMLLATENYKKGHGNRSKLKWEPDTHILQALDSAFHLSFQNVEATGFRFLIGVDVSASLSSMALGSSISAAASASLMSMVFTRVEKEAEFLVFSEGNVTPVALSPEMSLMQVTAELVKIPDGSTDCALPILWALEKDRPVDVFLILTNNETWFGKANPAEALKVYRQKMGIFSKLIVCGMTTTGLSVADPDDHGMLDICGFDSRAVEVIRNFAMGLI